MTQHEEPTAATAARAAAKLLQELHPGALADLRRMEQGRRAPAFWRLAARYRDTIGRPSQEETWARIVRIIALLTPTGEPSKRPTLHVAARRLGAVLCDGGDPAWPDRGAGVPRPMFSELRLAKLIAARGTQRAILLQRAARALARSMPPGSGVNVVDIAYALLRPDDNRTTARHYYDRLDAAERTRQPQEGTSE